VRTYKAPSVIFGSIALLLAAANILLLRQNLQMRREIEKVRSPLLEIGETVPSFSGMDVTGQPLPIGYTGRESTRVLLYFTPTCPYCREQFPYWRQVAEGAASPKFQVMGIVSDREDRAGVAAYLRSFGCEHLPVAFVTSHVLTAYKLSMTPTTLVVGNKGKVEAVWAGKWGSTDLASASSLFGIAFSQH